MRIIYNILLLVSLSAFSIHDELRDIPNVIQDQGYFNLIMDE